MDRGPKEVEGKGTEEKGQRREWGDGKQGREGEEGMIHPPANSRIRRWQQHFVAA